MYVSEPGLGLIDTALQSLGQSLHQLVVILWKSLRRVDFKCGGFILSLAGKLIQSGSMSTRPPQSERYLLNTPLCLMPDAAVACGNDATTAT